MIGDLPENFGPTNAPPMTGMTLTLPAGMAPTSTVNPTVMLAL